MKNMATWKGYRFQNNGVVFISDTNDLAKEKITRGERYLEVEDKGKKRYIKVAKIIYALFNGDGIKIKKFSRMWDVQHKDGNPSNCRITNLRFRSHQRSKIPPDIRKRVLADYEPGVRGHGYHSLSIKYGLYMYQVKNIIEQDKRRRQAWEKKS